MFGGEDEITQRFRPDMGALVVLCQLGIAFVLAVFAAAFQRFSH